MKKALFLIISAIFISNIAAAATYTYKCQPFKNNEDGFLTDGYAILTVDENSIRFQQYDGYGNNSLMRDYLYKMEGIVGGNGKLKDLVEFSLTEETRAYGGSLDKIYIDEALISGGYELRVGGRGGRLTFLGQGFGYDWNLCKFTTKDGE